MLSHLFAAFWLKTDALLDLGERLWGGALKIEVGEGEVLGVGVGVGRRHLAGSALCSGQPGRLNQTEPD